MAKLKRGQKMVCVPCAREVVISNAGVSRTTLWCCGRPMVQKAKAAPKKKTAKKTTKKRTKK
jgi:hypothetical protein